MNICGEYTALLDAFLDGELSPEEMGGVQSHLEACPACRAYVDDGLAMRAAFPDTEDQEVPEGFALGVMEAVRGTSLETAPKAGRRKTVWFRTAASLAACFVMVLALRYVLPDGGFRDVSMQDTAGADAYAPQMASMTPEADAGELEDQWKSGVTAYAAPETANEEPDPAEAAPQSNIPESVDTAKDTRLKTVPGAESASAPPAIEEPAAPEVFSDSAAASPRSWEELREPEFRAVIPADQADLLAGYPTLTDGDGAVWHCLTGESYRALAAALEARGLIPEVPAEDVRDGDTVLVQAAEG